MKRDEDGNVTLTTQEARAGETSGHVRVILIAGTILAVVGLGAALLYWI